MNANKLTAFLSVPAIVLSATAQAKSDDGKIVLQLQQLGKGSQMVLVSLNDENVNSLRPELEKRFALYQYFLERLNWKEVNRFSFAYQKELSESLNTVRRPLEDSAIRELISKDPRFNDAVIRFLGMVKEKADMLMPPDELLLMELAPSLPETFSELDKAMLMLQQICLKVPEVFTNDIKSDSKKAAGALKVYNDAIEKLLAKIGQNMAAPMSEAAALRYLDTAYGNMETLRDILSSSSEIIAEIMKDGLVGSEFQIEFIRFAEINRRMSVLEEKRIMPMDVVLLYSLERQFASYSPYEQTVLIWQQLDVDVAKKLNKAAALAEEMKSSELEVYNKICKKLISRLESAESKRMGEEAMALYWKVSQENGEGISRIEHAFEKIREKLSTEGDASLVLDLHCWLTLSALLMEEAELPFIESVYGLVSELKNSQPQGFSDFDKTMHALLQVCQVCARTANDATVAEAEQAVNTLRQYNQAGEQMLSSINGAAGASMTEAAAWRFVEAYYLSVPLLNAFTVPAPELKGKWEPVSQACPAFAAEVERSVRLIEESLPLFQSSGQ